MSARGTDRTDRLDPLDRRDFLKVGAAAGGGLLLAVYLPGEAASLGAGPAGAAAPAFEPNAFLRIDPDGAVTITVARSDMGQGVRTAMPMIVAEELDADWDAVRIEQADAHARAYGSQMTVGSSSVRGGAWTRLREAGASARAMLVAAAAARWNVDASSLRTEAGRVLHPASGRSFGYGELAGEAAALPVPEDPPLKDPADFRIIGTSPAQLDVPDKVTGRARFGIDARTPGMLHATVVRCPVFGGFVAAFDPAPALAVPGVREVVEVSDGVAVVAENTWAAFQGAQALDVTWDTGDFSMSSDDILASFQRLADGEAAVATDEGDVDAALAAAAHRIEAVYEMPYLAHATMEPMNCTADVRPDRCEIWAPTQNPQGTQQTAARITGLDPERVTVHVTLLGCGWGRRSGTDFVTDAVETSMKVGAPVQVLWTREEDTRHDFYRPAMYARAEGAVDAAGKVSAMKLRMVAPPIGGRRGRGVDRNAVDGAANMSYRPPNLRVDNASSDVPVPTGYWRAVGPTTGTFVVESFLDELAHAAGRDPVEVRRELLAQEPRVLNVLNLAAEKSGWGTPLPAGRARGVALVNDKGGRVAQVAEVSVEDGRVRVHRVTIAADCGRVIHPDIVRGQLSGAMVAGLTAALHGEITLEGGAVVQGNFHDYPMLRMREMPAVDVHLVESDEEPGGAGEPGVPPIAPAVANALFALTGRRIRKLPIREVAAASEAGPGG